MPQAPHTGLTPPAVAGPVERGVRQHFWDAEDERWTVGLQRCHALRTATSRRLEYDGVVLIPTAAELVGKRHDAGAAVAPRTDLHMHRQDRELLTAKRCDLVLKERRAMLSSCAGLPEVARWNGYVLSRNGMALRGCLIHADRRTFC